MSKRPRENVVGVQPHRNDNATRITPHGFVETTRMLSADLLDRLLRKARDPRGLPEKEISNAKDII